MTHFNTPHRRRGDEYTNLILNLNDEYGLDLPQEKNIDWSPRAWKGVERNTICWRCVRSLRNLFFRDKDSAYRVIDDFAEWVAGRDLPPSSRSRSRTRGQRGPARGRGSPDPAFLSNEERNARLEYFTEILRDQIYLLTDGKRTPPEGERGRVVSPKRRKLESDDEEEEFHTAPNSPTNSSGSASASTSFGAMPPPKLNFDMNLSMTLDGNCDRGDMRDPSKMSFMERLTQGLSGSREQVEGNPQTSFSTVVDSVFSSQGRSFDTDATELIDTQSTYADSVVESWLAEGETTLADTESVIRATRQRIIDQLLEKGPFSVKNTFPKTIPLLHRYELERIGRAWGVPLDKMFPLAHLPVTEYNDFWSWIEGHSQRKYRAVPEKPSRKAWSAAVGDFKTDRHSEVVVFTGEMNWVAIDDGLFNLKLHPPKTEKTCRFHRRFGSDRFLSLTIPDLSRPPLDVGSPSHPSLLRESVSAWITRNDHLCLGRRWRPFYIEEVKSKSKEKREPRFRVDFFAIDGIDFCHNLSYNSLVSPPGQLSDAHTPMSIDDLVEWHMSKNQNSKQANCKLFQRFSLGLSKTFVSVTLRRTQVLTLRDDPRWKQVMNDGCALMSRALAKKICEELGITGDGNKHIPSAFQGRIAGAKGLWMVDRVPSKHRRFSENGGEDIWIEISDSQLKIHPHPQQWSGPVDEEKLTFEVVSWSKPLRPVELNVQLLVILDHGGNVKEYIAQLAKRGLNELADDLKNVLEADNNLLCLGLMQKLKPPGEAGNRSRQLDRWSLDDGEFVIRLCQAGFSPSFYPLRQRLQKVFKEVIERRVEELHIPVPLSTYAYCISDPYGALEPDEVHFAFSSNWQDPDGNFQESELMDTEVLVGRLPAHLPSDIQRRRAVYKSELRHFKDVIVFSVKGDMPLAHMLSGGDYDGDTPWICWDPVIVNSFRNSDLPETEFPAEHFGLSKHSIPMSELKTTGDFLQSAFEFNLTTSSLGRCTVEHEKIAYAKSIDCPEAKELACLLSHLVDGRKGGVYLPEESWKEYKKTKGIRSLPWPAYRESCNERRGKPKKTNIVDYVKFFVAERHSIKILTDIESQFPINDNFRAIDSDLTRPWRETQKRANDERPRGGKLHLILDKIQSSIHDLNQQWGRSKTEQGTYSHRAQQLADTARSLEPPSYAHPLVHAWQNSSSEWHRLLASLTYQKYPGSTFIWLAFGDVLCDFKAETLPSRSVTNDAMSCYKVNQKFVSQLTATELPANMESGEFGDDEFTYEGEEEVEALMLGVSMGYYSELDDGLSIQ